MLVNDRMHFCLSQLLKIVGLKVLVSEIISVTCIFWRRICTVRDFLVKSVILGECKIEGKKTIQRKIKQKREKQQHAKHGTLKNVC